MKKIYQRPTTTSIPMGDELMQIPTLSMHGGTTPSPGGGDAKQDFTDDDEMENNMSPTTPSSLWED